MSAAVLREGERIMLTDSKDRQYLITLKPGSSFHTHTGIILHDVLFAPFFAGAAGPGHCWHWNVYVDRNNLWHHFARFAASR